MSTLLVRLAAFVIYVLTTISATGMNCPIQPVIRPERSVYFVNQPIDLMLQITNTGTQPVGVLIAYPAFSGLLELSSASGNLQLKKQVPPAEDRVPIINIDPGARFQLKVFLQTFFRNPAVGHYRVDYSVRLVCANQEVSPSERNTFEFDVANDNPKAAKELARTLSSELETTDFWTQRTTAEAISLWSDPLVIPLAIKIMGMGFADQAVKALEQLKGNEDAQAAVLHALQRGSPAQRKTAIEVLARWRVTLSEEQLRTLLKGTLDRQFRIALINYTEQLGPHQYLGVLNDLARDADEIVSEKARQALTHIQ